jgi:hypothetical protein
MKFSKADSHVSFYGLVYCMGKWIVWEGKYEYLEHRVLQLSGHINMKGVRWWVNLSVYF